MNVPLDNRYEHTITFNNSIEQDSYFQSLLFQTIDNYKYQKKTNEIQLAVNYEDVRAVNYLYYINKNKTIYCFVTSKQYVNENTTTFYIETDVMQTYMFNHILMESFTEREHVSSDIIGKNLTDENLELGEFVVNSQENTGLLSNLAIVLSSTVMLIYPELTNLYGRMYNGIYGGVGYFYVDPADWADLLLELNNIDNAGKGDAIQAIFMMPMTFLVSDWDNGTSIFKFITSTVNRLVSVTKSQTSLNGYVPKNKKLFTHPYNYLLASNNLGGAAVYKYEQFASTNCAFNLYGHVAPNPTVKLVPTSYKGIADNYEEGLTMGGYPLCSWKYGVYENWLAQNQNSLNMQYMGSALSTLGGGAILTGGIASGNPALMLSGAGNMASGLMPIFGAMAKQKDMQVQPPQARGNTSTGYLNVANGKQDFTFYKMSITYEYAKRIDDYFTMYGYKVSELKVPETHSRKYWNYIKTINCNISASIDNDDKIKICSIYDHGVTLWHYIAGDFDICDYSKSNIII
jgi:hypothetical protein